MRFCQRRLGGVCRFCGCSFFQVSLHPPAFLTMVALNTVRQCQRKPAEYSNTSLTSTITSSSRSITPESSTPRTPYPKVHLNPPPRPHSFVTAEGYIIEEFPQSRSISEPSRPKHRRFHSTPNASSPGQSNYIETHKSRHSIATRGHSARCSSPLASPPLSPVLITNDPIPNVADPTPCPNSSELLPTSPAPIWPASPRRSVHVTRNLKLKKPRPKRTIEDEPLRPSFGGTLTPKNSLRNTYDVVSRMF